jgi:hypothetical protein
MQQDASGASRELEVTNSVTSQQHGPDSLSSLARTSQEARTSYWTMKMCGALGMWSLKEANKHTLFVEDTDPAFIAICAPNVALFLSRNNGYVDDEFAFYFVNVEETQKHGMTEATAWFQVRQTQRHGFERAAAGDSAQEETSKTTASSS